MTDRSADRVRRTGELEKWGLSLQGLSPFLQFSPVPGNLQSVNTQNEVIVILLKWHEVVRKRENSPMDIGKIEGSALHRTAAVKQEKKHEEALLYQADSVQLSLPSLKNEASPSKDICTQEPPPQGGKERDEKVPLTITLHVDGKTVEKKIMGRVTDKEIVLEIKETNDVHGNMASVATQIKPDDFWVDAGDAWQDYSFSSALSGGQQEVELMNGRDCDIATTGNHFYDDAGTEGGEKLIQMSRFPYLSANTEGMTPYLIADVEGAKIAFIGVRTPQKKFLMVDPSLVKDVEIKDPIEAVKKSVEEVTRKGVSNIVVLSHLGLKASPEFHEDTATDKDLATQVPGIDLIIGGHSHTPTFETVEVNGTRIVQAGIASHSDVKTDELYLGEVSLTIDRASQKIISIGHKLIPIDRNAPIDRDIEKIVDQYHEKEAAALGEKCGLSPRQFTHELKTMGDSSLGNLITDAMRKEAGAEVAILDSNFFSNRKNAAPATLPAGEIAMKDLVSLSPWMGKSLDARIETWDVKGKDIKRLLEEGVNKLLGPKKDQGLYQVSGIEMTYDPKNTEGNRVVHVSIGGQPLDPDKPYRLTTTYTLGNWNPIFSDRPEDSVKDGPKLRLLMADYLKNGGALALAGDGRIKQARQSA
jgi:2',3'-cyclic-nucleotide 2'-phosphodiesterase (5'-nucleotidase family)